jgi:Rod binding domain-containing protein
MNIPPVNAPANVALAKAQQEASKDATLGKKFEAVFLTQFVDQMMKTVDPSAFGGEKQAEMWRSFMSEALAEQLAEQGGFGFSANVTDAISAYQRGRDAI